MKIVWVKCGRCSGSGYTDFTCAPCEGGGMVEKVVAEEGDCRRCDGFGSVAIVNRLFPCPSCKGTAREEEEEEDYDYW